MFLKGWQMARANNPYGDGRAALRISAWLLARLRGGSYPQPFADRLAGNAAGRR